MTLVFEFDFECACSKSHPKNLTFHIFGPKLAPKFSIILNYTGQTIKQFSGLINFSNSPWPTKIRPMKYQSNDCFILPQPIFFMHIPELQPLICFWFVPFMPLMDGGLWFMLTSQCLRLIILVVSRERAEVESWKRNFSREYVRWGVGGVRWS